MNKRRWSFRRRVGTLLLVIMLSSLTWLPIIGQPEIARAQGIFGCPLPSERDCNLLIDGIENAQDLDSVNLDALQVAFDLAIDGDPTEVQMNLTGPTGFAEDGDINAVDWTATIDINSLSLPLAFKLVEGQFYFNAEPDDADNSWLTYDPLLVENGDLDLTSIFTTLTFESLLSILNEIGDGVRWSTGRDISLDGQEMAVFHADFSTASLVRTSFAYEQFVALAIAGAEQLGFDTVDPNLLEFGLDFLVTTLADQLGGAMFRITWMIGRDDHQIYEVSMTGEASIDPLFLSFIVGDTVPLPDEIAYDVLIGVELSEHNAAETITAPENISTLDPQFVDQLLNLVLNQLLGDFLPEF